MKTTTEQLTEQQMKTINGGDGILAYDPVTGQPFAQENGGYGNSDGTDSGPQDGPTVHQNPLGYEPTDGNP